MSKLIHGGRLKAFSGARQEVRRAAADWVLRTFTGDAVIRASGEGINTAGGALVPDEIEAEILSLRDTVGVFRRYARVLQMGSDRKNWPRRTGGLGVNFTAEGVPLAESSAAWDSLGLTAKKIAGLTRISTEIAEDEAVGLAAWIVEEFAYALAAKEDACGFTGDGSSTYYGIRGVAPLLIDGNHNAGKVTAASGHNTFALLDATDVTSLIAALPAYAMNSACWFVSAYGFATTLARLGATAGNDVGPDGRPSLSYLGWPVVLTPPLPGSGTHAGAVMIAFGDLSLAAALGSRRGVTAAVSEHRYLDQDQLGIRATERADINVHDLGDGTTAGPLVGLVGG